MYAGRQWEDGAFGTVLQDRLELEWMQVGSPETGPRIWKFMLGLKEHAAAASTGWSMHLETHNETGPEQIVAVARNTPPTECGSLADGLGMCVSCWTVHAHMWQWNTMPG